MKRPTMLVEALLHQAARDLDLSVERDVQTVAHRCKHEGFSFLTITLPCLSDALERGIEDGTFTCPTSFSRHGRLPRFLGGFFKRVFDKDGRLLQDACPDVIFYIRQICRFMKKLKIGCTPDREDAAISQFLAIEDELRQMTSHVERKDDILDKVAGVIWSQVFPEIDNVGLVCHHGPGVTADKRLSNERYFIRYWHERSEFTYPSDLHCFPNYRLAGENSGVCTSGSDGPRFLKLRDELPVRVVFVPKTQLAPRVIAIEPSHVQYMQQSLKDYLYGVLESHSLTKHSIRFSRQDVNQRLAYRSSIDRRLATLDLKDASDRVHLHLVQRIFRSSGILEYLEDARSLHATLPNGQNIVLFKYASMGSALCFPVEAMVFYTLVQTAMHCQDGARPSSQSIKHYSRMIDIYGDDIIVPVDYTDAVVSTLESYSLKVNINKSFRNSHFRESCGADYYKGVAVNPVYARMVPHDDLRRWDASTIMAWNATADLFYLRGMWYISQVIRDLLAQVVRRAIPRSREFGPGLVHFSLLFSTDLRWNVDLQGFKQKRLHFQPSKKKDVIDGHELACLNKWGLQTVSERRLPLRPFDTVRRDSLRRDEFRRDVRGSQRGDGSEVSTVDVRISKSGLRYIPPSTRYEEWHCLSLPSMVAVCNVAVQTPTEHGIDGRSSDNCLNEIPIDPMRYLRGVSEGLDFHSSTKRGSFKSTCRWVNLLG